MLVTFPVYVWSQIQSSGMEVGWVELWMTAVLNNGSVCYRQDVSTLKTHVSTKFKKSKTSLNVKCGEDEFRLEIILCSHKLKLHSIKKTKQFTYSQVITNLYY